MFCTIMWRTPSWWTTPARPKSAILADPSVSKRMLAGLMSRWNAMGLLFIICDSPLAVPSATWSRCCQENWAFPSLLLTSLPCRSPHGRSSYTRYFLLSCWAQPSSVTTLGCLKRLSTRTSSSKPSRPPMSFSTFTATSVPPRSVPRKTAPAAPSPRRCLGPKLPVAAASSLRGYSRAMSVRCPHQPSAASFICSKTMPRRGSPAASGPG
mmetsp:Transcript_60820/g.157785  ORF Transcript_60820/g.157785 Transcript_60820/m.157785 type:complete len:210 (-) Transcript_60820:231-860(-)